MGLLWSYSSPYTWAPSLKDLASTWPGSNRGDSPASLPKNWGWGAPPDRLLWLHNDWQLKKLASMPPRWGSRGTLRTDVVQTASVSVLGVHRHKAGLLTLSHRSGLSNVRSEGSNNNLCIWKKRGEPQTIKSMDSVISLFESGGSCSSKSPSKNLTTRPVSYPQCQIRTKL